MADEISPDDKDWTWTLQQRCAECGFDACAVTAAELPAAIRAATLPWGAVLARADVTVRRTPARWSDLEYGAHVRDVCRIFDQRLTLMLTADDPFFDNWDQDATAIAQRYDLEDPAAVADAIGAAASELAGDFEQVRGEQWQRTGTRSNGSQFTVLTLGQYCLHDLVHHLHDVNASRVDR